MPREAGLTLRLVHVSILVDHETSQKSSIDYSFSLTYAAELVASALVIGYWSDLNPGIWITICTVPVIVLNLLSVRWYGNAEIATASIKVLTFVVLIITGIIIDLGGAPDGDRRGFRYWKNPGAMVGDTHLERFLGLFACFVKASFAYGGSETVILTAAECKDPSRQIPRAAKRVIYRILFFCKFNSCSCGDTTAYLDQILSAFSLSA